ncbi:MAG: ribosomal RNA small subunit methyltransferase A [Candidatus Aminicenantes bacterium]|nr:ribosomal RNA small subunit methyltransferase A [Candidatus Aminicenantes bacterium]
MAPAKLGQHFLSNKNVAERMIRTFFPVRGSILEIGPGTGILTDLLIKYRDEKENEIFAVEVDKELYHKIKAKHEKNVNIIYLSVLNLGLETICPQGKINLVGNVPYYISREIIDWIIAGCPKIEKGMFMMQKEFADRLSLPGPSRDNSARSLMFNYLFDLRKLFTVNPGSFSPPPKVKSTVFLFEKKKKDNHEKIDSGHFYLFLKDCFRNRRKTLFNNLQTKYPEEQLREIFDRTKINPKIRAEQVNPKNFLSLFREL